MIVLDASIAFSFLFPDETSELADKVFDHLRTVPGLVPSHWHAEIANGMLMAVRRGRMTERFRRGAIERLLPMDIQVDDQIRDQLLQKGVALADRYLLTSYDVAYLQLALKRKTPLATLDRKLTEAAIAEGVPVFGQTG